MIILFLAIAAFIFPQCIATAATEKPGIMLGAYIPPAEAYEPRIKKFDEATGKFHTHVLFFCSFDFEGIGSYPYLFNQIRNTGKIPILTWQPGKMGRPDPDFSYSRFLAGEHDNVIRKMARQIRDYGDTVILRFAHEMNISSAPAWPGHPWNNGDAEGFKRMWRYVHDIFEKENVRNVLWAWSPNYMGAAQGLDTYSNYNNLYPGDEYVDIVGVSGLNYGDRSPAGPGFSVTVQWLHIPILRNLMAGSYNPASEAFSLRNLASLSNGKPQAIFEFGTVGETPYFPKNATSIPKEDWIRQGYDAIAHTEEFDFVRLVVWYNDIAFSGNVPSDMRVVRNSEIEPPVPQCWTKAYKEAISDPIFVEQPLSEDEMNPGSCRRAASIVDPASYPQHEFWLSVRPGGEVKKGGTVAAAYFLVPAIYYGPEYWTTDAYVWAELPDGRFYAYSYPNRWRRFDPNTAPPPPTARGFSVKRQSRGMAFAQFLSPNLPAGEYKVFSVLTNPGTDPRSPGLPDLRTSTFTLRD